jgi:hypothetical protein
MNTHRAAWILKKGPIPKGLSVCHTCDNGLCVNVEHLYLGTHAQNMRDMAERGRARKPNKAKTHCKRGHEMTEENTGLYIRNGHTRDRRWPSLRARFEMGDAPSTRKTGAPAPKPNEVNQPKGFRGWEVNETDGSYGIRTDLSQALSTRPNRTPGLKRNDSRA